jgi:hypothetical protein
MNTVIERTTVAMHVDVCSLYLLDRDGDRLTLAATNGLDPGHVGKVSLAYGGGHHGRRRQVATGRSPCPTFASSRGSSGSVATTCRASPRCCRWPLTWNDRVVGVLNVQTRASRAFTPSERAFLVTIAALLGGIIEKGRLQAEREAQLESLTALDVARAELLSLVTHELRTPLSVVRAYLDLLGDAAQGYGDPPPRASAQAWRDAAIEQVTRLRRPRRFVPRRRPRRRPRAVGAAAVRRRRRDRRDPRHAGAAAAVLPASVRAQRRPRLGGRR